MDLHVIMNDRVSVTGDTRESIGASYIITIFFTFELVVHCNTKNVVQLIVL